MAEIWQDVEGDTRTQRAGFYNPLHVQVTEDSTIDRGMPPIAGRTRAHTLVIPGIGVSSAYSDGDCFGTLMEFPNMLRPTKGSGLIHTVTYLDLDDEGLQVDVHFFSRPIASPGADNAAFAPGDDALEAYIGTASFAGFFNFGSNQVSSGAYYIAVPPQANTSIFAHAVARGALNIAAGNLPKLRIVVLPD